LFRYIFALILFFVFGSAVAVEFSARAVQQYPQGKPRTAVISVGEDGVRREYQQNKQTIIDIYRPSKQLRLVIYPGQQAYYQYDGVKIKTGMSDAKKTVSTNPCTESTTQRCRMLGREHINGRLTDKWEVSRKVKNKIIKALIWVDVQRGQALRQFFPDGSRMELLRLKDEKINGRDTEKWVLKLTRPGGKTEQTYQWYDPQLGIIIKEIIPGGYVRELKDIKIGKQPDALFNVPAGYRKLKIKQPVR